MFKLFDFKCLKCGHTEELLIEKDNIKNIKCSICGGEVKRLVASPPFHLKGSVWARDNYGLKGNDKGK